MSRLLVLKLGGSVLSDEKAVREAATFVAKAAAEARVVVVVSALKGVTDDLVKKAYSASQSPDPELYDQLVSMGERIAARIFALALRSLGVKCEVVDVDTPYWPIVTDDRHGDADPLVDETLRACETRLRPLLEGSVVPVVCGFIGVSKQGHITTLGRGGSDTTATLLGKCLRADEVVLVKDVDGIWSADPARVKDAKKLDAVRLSELSALARSGAKVIQDKALRYVDGYRLRVTSLREGLRGGTLILNDEEEVGSNISADEVSMVTLVCVGGQEPHRLVELVGEQGIRPLAVTFDAQSATIYTTDSVGEEGLHTLVSKGLVKAFAIKRGLACITVSGKNLEGTPGVILRIAEPLYRHGINLYGISTSANNVRVFLQKELAEKARSLISSSFNPIPAMGGEKQ